MFGPGTIHMVSAWASENRMVQDQQKVNEKFDQITPSLYLQEMEDIA
jgi:hypothetical protein